MNLDGHSFKTLVLKDFFYKEHMFYFRNSGVLWLLNSRIGIWTKGFHFVSAISIFMSLDMLDIYGRYLDGREVCRLGYRVELVFIFLRLRFKPSIELE